MLEGVEQFLLERLILALKSSIGTDIAAESGAFGTEYMVAACSSRASRF